MPSSDEVIITKLDAIHDDIVTLKQALKELNGQVRKNREDIVKLEATCLRMDAIKLGMVVGGVSAIITVIMAIAGVI